MTYGVQVTTTRRTIVDDSLVRCWTIGWTIYGTCRSWVGALRTVQLALDRLLRWRRLDWTSVWLLIIWWISVDFKCVGDHTNQTAVERKRLVWFLRSKCAVSVECLVEEDGKLYARPNESSTGWPMKCFRTQRERESCSQTSKNGWEWKHFSQPVFFM